jgi:hypothetical protein
MKPSLYIETTIAGYLTGKPSRDIIVAARQQITSEWWARRRPHFELYVSQIVLDEAGEGEPEAARRRLSTIENVPLLAISEEVISLTQSLLRARVLPQKAARDAAHIAVTAVHGVQFLLTWNCVHLANAEIFEDVEAVCRLEGYKCPVICTPEELMGE